MQQLEACPICRSTAIRYWYSGPTTRPNVDRKMWDVWQCRECTHGFMNPQPCWEELAPYYGEGYEAYDPCHGAHEDDEGSAARARADGRLRHIPIPTGKRLLDVGCGGGFFIRVAQKLGASVTGVEPSAHGVEQARKCGLNVFHGTLDEFVTVENVGAFDVITANHVIEHVPRPVETLALMRNLLAPGGYIWIGVPNADYPIARKLGGYWHSSDLPYHLMQFSPASIALAGERAGLRMHSQQTISLPDEVAASLRLYLRYRWRVPRRLTAHLRFIEGSWAPALARRMDRRGSGEAIMTTFTLR